MNSDRRTILPVMTARTIAVACCGMVYLSGCAKETTHESTKEATKSSQETASTAGTPTANTGTSTTASGTGEKSAGTSDSAGSTTTKGSTSSTSSGESNSGAGSSNSGGSKETTASTSAAGKDASKDAKASDKSASSNSPAAASADQKVMSFEGDLPEIESASKKVNLAKMPDTLVICTVNKTPITVGQYRQEFKQRQMKTQAYLSVSQQLESNLIEEAKRRHITLSKEEKAKLLETTKKAKIAAGQAINKFLDKSELSSKQFDEKVLRVGLALKASQASTRDALLNELVDQELMVGAAREKGYYSSAFNKCVELKKSDQFKQFMLETGLDPSAAQAQIISRELISMFVKDIQKTVSVSDAEVQEAYDNIKDRLKHGDLIRISQIVIAAPSTDTANNESVKTQLKKQYPQDTPKQLQDRTDKFNAEQKKKAEDLLAQLKKGGDFAQLANKNTDDPMNKAQQNGGDVGYKDKSTLLPEFLKKLDTLKVGDVYPELIKDQFGYHIIKLTDSKPAGTLPLAEVKSEIKDKLLQQKQTIAVYNWLKDKHKTAEIKLSPEFQKIASSTPDTEVKLQ